MSQHDGEQEIFAEGIAARALRKCNKQVFIDMEDIRNSAFPISESESLTKLLKSIQAVMKQGINDIYKLKLNDNMQKVVINTVKKIDNLINNEFKVLGSSVSENGVNIEKLKFCCERISSEALDIIDSIKNTKDKMFTKVLSVLRTIVINITSEIFNITCNFTAGSWQLFKTWRSIKSRMEYVKEKGLRIFDEEIQKNISKALTETTDEYRSRAEKEIDKMQVDYEKCITDMGVLLIAECMLTTFYIASMTYGGLGIVSYVLSNMSQYKDEIAKHAMKVAKGANVALTVAIAAGALVLLFYGYRWYYGSPKPEENVHHYHTLYQQQKFTCTKCAG